MFLGNCIESVLNQTYREFELILVDDGSPDSCPQICDKYASGDNRIIVIHQENHGPVHARRSGLRAAVGKYISFIDADDWLEPDMYERMLNLAEKNEAEIVVTGYFEENNNITVHKRNVIDSGIYQGKDMNLIRSRLMFSGKYYETGIIPALWNKLFLREKLLNTSYRTDDMVRLGEDALISFPVISSSNCVVIDNEYAGYHYQIIEQSMTRQLDEQYVNRLFALFDALRSFFSKDPEMMNQLSYYTLFLAEYGLGRLCYRGKKVFKTNKIIEMMIEKIQLTEYLKNLDMSVFNSETEKRKIEALRSNKPWNYIRLVQKEAITNKMRMLFGK